MPRYLVQTAMDVWFQVDEEGNVVLRMVRKGPDAGKWVDGGCKKVMDPVTVNLPFRYQHHDGTVVTTPHVISRVAVENISKRREISPWRDVACSC